MYISRTQDQIVGYLSKYRIASCKELVDSLGTTRANINYHLSSLRDRGIIEVVPGFLSSPTNRGRRWKYYRLSVQFTPQNYAEILIPIIRQLKNIRGDSEENIAEFLASELSEEFRLEPNITRRLTQAIYFLNKKHHLASWEASRLGPRIIFHNCPYLAVVDQIPALCRMDQLLLKKILGADVQQTSRISKTDLSISACVFQVNREL